MNKAVKLSMIGFGIVLAVVTLAVIIFASSFDLNNYKERIARAVKDETGRTLTFDGDLNLEIFPGLGVSLGGVSLSNAKGFSDKYMVRAKAAHVSVKIFPLIVGKVKFGHLELDGLTINLSRKKDGLANWGDLVGRKSVEENASSGEDKQFSLDIEGVTIRDASMAWDDEVSDVMSVLRDVNLQTGQIYKGAPFPMQADLEFGCSSPQISGKLSLSGKSSLDFENRVYGHMDMKLTLEAKGEAVPGGQMKGEAGVQFLVLDFNKEHAQLTGLSATAYGTTVGMDGTLEGLTGGLRKVVGTMNVDPFDARNMLAQLGFEAPDTADPKALARVGGMADFIYSPDNLHLKSFTFEVDGSHLAGSARFSKQEGEPLAHVRLDAGNVDLDRYLPPDHAEKKEASKEAVAAGNKSDRFLDTHRLRRLHLDIEAKIAKLRVEGMWLESVNAKVKARRGMIHISPLSANLYGGSLSSGVTINATGKYPVTDLIAGLNKVDIGALSRDVSGKSSYAGVLDFNAALSCQGERVPVMLRSMDGKISFHLANGVFPGVDLMEMAKETHASKDKRDAIVEATTTDSTKFGSINGTGVIKGGVLRNRDLEVKAPGLRADGHGTVILPTHEIDYLLKVKLVASSKGQGGESSDDLYGIMVPIRVAGSIEKPRYWVSLTEYVKALGGAVIGTAGSLIGGVTGVIKGVGKVVIGGDTPKDDTKKEAAPEKKRGLFDFF